MKDIGSMLDKIMQEKQCSSVYALLLLHEQNERNKYGIHKLQSEPCEKTCGRLCNKSSIKKSE